MDEGPDVGRAWFVALAAFVINMITAGIFRAQGLLFVAFINNYGVDRKGAAIPFSIRTAMRNLLAPVVGILGQKYGAPSVVAIGGILGALSSALCFFATDLLWITLIWGLLNGVAMALVTVLPQVVISQYFVKYRTTATGLSFSGGCTGSFVFPAILDYLLHTYGLDGTFFILAGMIMHTIPAAMILKKPPWLKDNVRSSTSGKETKELKDGKTDKSTANGKKCECGIQVGNGIHDTYPQKTPRETENNISPRKRSYSCNALTYQMNSLQRTTMMPSLSMTRLNYKNMSSNPEQIFDIDLDYLKLHDDLLFQMLSMEIPNMEISYRAILLEVEQDDLWHPEKNEILQEIENIYYHIEKSLEIDPVSSKNVRANGLYLKRTLPSGALTMSKKSESLRAVRRYFKTYRDRGLQLSKIRSAPNISNIYNELARKDYVISKLKQLCNSNEIRIISHLCQYNPKHVLKVLFQVRTLYKIYNDLEVNEQCEGSEHCESVETGDIPIHHKASCSKTEVEFKKPNEQHNSFKAHIKTAVKLHTNAIFLLICCTRSAFFLSFNPVVTTIVDFAMDRGLQEEDGKYIIGALSFGDLLGRAGFGWVTDRGYVSLPRYMLVVMSVLAVCSASVPLMYSRWTILSVVALFGMIQGSLFIRHPVLVAKYLNPDQQSIAVGCMEFFSGIICLIMPLYIGFFRDTMGSYDPIYYINGILVFISAIAWLFEPRMVSKSGNLPENS